MARSLGYSRHNLTANPGKQEQLGYTAFPKENRTGDWGFSVYPWRYREK